MRTPLPTLAMAVCLAATTAFSAMSAHAAPLSPPRLAPAQGLLHRAGLEQEYDCYTRFYTDAYPDVSIFTCNRKSGSSGVYVLSNLTGRDLHLCWTLVFNDGRESKGCNSRLRAGEESASACYACNTGNNGVKRVIWHRIDPAD